MTPSILKKLSAIGYSIQKTCKKKVSRFFFKKKNKIHLFYKVHTSKMDTVAHVNNEKKKN